MKGIMMAAVTAMVVAMAGCTGTVTCNLLSGETGTGNAQVVLHTSMGDITAEIFMDQVPNTGLNFIRLAESGYYDGTIFHRIITDFMMQGGDPTATGGGGEAHPDADPDGNGMIEDEIHPDLKHSGAGILSMAKRSPPHTGSSQFFITFAATPWLDGVHTVFGEVTDGMEVVQAVNAQAASGSGAPRTTVTFESASVSCL